MRNLPTIKFFPDPQVQTPGKSLVRQLSLIAAAAVLGWSCSDGRVPAGAEVDSPPVEFVDDQRCAECHRRQFQLWRDSHHDLAMQPATESTVLGDFGDVTFTHFGVKTRFYRREGRYYVHTESEDGSSREFEVRFTLGVDPLQQYLVEFPGGRLQCLPVAWDTRGDRWFHLYPDERIPPGDPLHWTGRYQNWNLMCAECHTTNLDKNYDPATDSYRTTYHAVDVSCQACHGPGGAHLQWAREYGGDSDSSGDKGLVVDFRGRSGRFEVEACAPCHSRRTRITPRWRHQGRLNDHFRTAILSEGLYYPDGQVLDEVYVYGSYVQSRMHQVGVRCSDCHDPHSLRLKQDGDALCTRCHQRQPPADFPTLKSGNYASAAHHFHLAESEGARCVACHMPERTYMIVDPRRDHSFRIPRPDLTVKLGTPNPCNGCHPERTPEWAQSRIAVIHGPLTGKRPHFGEAFAAGRTGEPEAEEQLVSIAGDQSRPAIVRATALELLRGYGAGIRAALTARNDEDSLVRAAAAAGLDGLQPGRRLEAVGPLLEDPIRIVRIEAARVLASVPDELMTDRLRPPFEAAVRELTTAQRAVADGPSAHFNLGVLNWELGRLPAAEANFAAALERDPGFAPAAVNLATLLSRQGRSPEAESVLRQASAKAAPEDRGQIQYHLGLLLAEAGRLEEAADRLSEAVRLMPGHARVRYNYGLALQRLGRRSDAETVLLAAGQADPDDPDILYALVVFFIQDEDWDRALHHLDLLRRRRPADPRLNRLERAIRQGRGNR